MGRAAVTSLTVLTFSLGSQGTWRAEVPEGGAKFEEIEFEDGRFDDYDEESSAPVGIEGLEAMWVKV